MKYLLSALLLLLSVPQIVNAQWVPVDSDFDTSAVNTLFLDTDGLYAGTGNAGIFFSGDYGESWITRNSGITNLNIKSITRDTSGFMYAGSKSLTLFTSADSGALWTAHTMVGTGTAISSVVTYGTYALAGQVNDGVFRSTDHGSNWTEMALCCASVLSLCVDQDGYAYAGTNAGRIYRSAGTYVSWDEMDSGLPAFPVRALLTQDTVVYAGTYGGGLAVSHDRGATWISCNDWLDNLNVISLTARDNRIFAGTDGGGVYVSADQGMHWMPANEGLTALNIFSLAADDSWLYAGTANNGLWKRPLSELTGLSNAEPVQTLKVYPQPADQYFILERNRETPATLWIYAADGRLVLEQSLNNSRTVINVSALLPGCYFVRCLSPESLVTRTLSIQ